jgi:hypothetical protein
VDVRDSDDDDSLGQARLPVLEIFSIEIAPLYCTLLHTEPVI